MGLGPPPCSGSPAPSFIQPMSGQHRPGCPAPHKGIAPTSGSPVRCLNPPTAQGPPAHRVPPRSPRVGRQASPPPPTRESHVPPESQGRAGPRRSHQGEAHIRVVGRPQPCLWPLTSRREPCLVGENHVPLWGHCPDTSSGPQWPPSRALRAGFLPYSWETSCPEEKGTSRRLPVWS